MRFVVVRLGIRNKRHDRRAWTTDSVTPPQPVPDQPAGGPYGYDWVGNRLNPPTGTNHMVYNAADQLTTWPGMHQYTYFPDGSLQEEKNADGSQVMKSYTYTPDGLMASATFDGKTLTNTWDAAVNLVSVNVGTNVYLLTYDVVADFPTAIRENSADYVREPSGELIARIDGTSTSYYHFDQLGSTRLLTDTSGSVTDKYDYDAYGAVIAHEKYAGSVEQPYRYVGRLGYYSYPQLGLVQVGLRCYDPLLGAFDELDVVRTAECSRYSYVEDKPNMGVDPSGAIWCKIVKGKLQCHWGSPPKNDKGCWVVPVDKIPKKYDKLKDMVKMFDMCADTGNLFDDGRRCKDAYDNAFVDHGGDPTDPLAKAVISKDHAASQGNRDAFMRTCTQILGPGIEEAKKWIDWYQGIIKKVCAL